MTGSLRTWLLRFLRVPAAPEVPSGSLQFQVFRASRRYYQYKLAVWGLKQLGAIAGLMAFLLFLSRFDFEIRYLQLALWGVEWLSWSTYLAVLPFSYLLVRMDFEMRWYILADRSLRIREGIVSLREKTMTFANIQQIAIRQNPLQRLLGIADVQVRTAGGGGSSSESSGHNGSESMHEAWFRRVDNAEEIRRAIRERVKLFRDSGLGDPDDDARAGDAGLAGAVDAARQLHEEVRGLRRGLLVRA